MKKYISGVALAAAALFSSCNDYLDTVPSRGDNEVLHSAEQVEALFNNSDLINTRIGMALTSSDDMGISTTIYDQMGWLTETLLNGFTYVVDDVANYPYGDEVWSKEYNKVFTANLVINGIDDVEDITADQRAQYLAQAHFVRALALWNLAQTYCMPYSSTTADSEAGLPLPLTNDYEGDVSRATLAETYRQIEADLTVAQQSPFQDVDQRWWVSQPAAEAMLARLCLFTGRYAEGADHARKALASSKVSLHDYNALSFMPQPVMSPSGDDETVNFSELYSLSPNELIDYQESYYAQYAEVSSGTYLIPSDALLSLYDHDADLRYQQFFNEHALWQQGIFYVGDDIQYHKHTNLWGEDMLPSGPSRPEMLLTLAECEARQGHVAEAMQAVNTLRRVRMAAGAEAIDLEASTQQEAVSLIIDERHREMPFSMRWQDVRRLAVNEVGYDDVTVVHEFYAVANNYADTSKGYRYILPVGSRRYAQPINSLEIKRTNGQIQQNSYTAADVELEEIEVGGGGGDWSDDDWTGGW